jgi:Uma2 family endonuclease
LRHYWAGPNNGHVYHQINVSDPGTWPNNYRIPDLVLLTPERFDVDCNTYFDGGPDVVVEIHSPGDEAYDKFDFYAKVAVREVWVLNRDTRRPEIYQLVDGAFQLREADSSGWVGSEVAGVEMRAAAEDKLEIRLAGRDDTLGRLP